MGRFEEKTAQAITENVKEMKDGILDSSEVGVNLLVDSQCRDLDGL